MIKVKTFKEWKASNMIFLAELKSDDYIKSAAAKLFDVTLNNGFDILSSGDPFAKALEIFGRKVVGNSLTKVLATQCSGVFGVFTSFMPSVSIIFVNSYNLCKSNY